MLSLLLKSRIADTLFGAALAGLSLAVAHIDQKTNRTQEANVMPKPY